MAHALLCFHHHICKIPYDNTRFNSNADKSSVDINSKKSTRDGETGIKWEHAPKRPSPPLLSTGPRTINIRRRTPFDALPPAAYAHPPPRLLPVSQHPPPCVWHHRSEANDDASTSPSTDTHVHSTCTALSPRDARRTSSSTSTEAGAAHSLHAHQPWPTPCLAPAGPKSPIENGRGYQPHPAPPTRKNMRTPLAPAPPGLRSFWRDNCMKQQ